CETKTPRAANFFATSIDDMPSTVNAIVGVCCVLGGGPLRRTRPISLSPFQHCLINASPRSCSCWNAARRRLRRVEPAPREARKSSAAESHDSHGRLWLGLTRSAIRFLGG